MHISLRRKALGTLYFLRYFDMYFIFVFFVFLCLFMLCLCLCRSEKSTSFLDLITGNIFTSVGLFLFPIAIIGMVVLILLWRKYRDSNYEESFGNFILEEVSEFFGRVQSESLGAVDSCTSLQFMGEDDSAHSTHPMIVGSSVPTSTKKKTKKGGKSSKFKSKTSVGNYESVIDNL